MGVKNANYKEFRVRQHGLDEGMDEAGNVTWPCSKQQETGHIVEADD